MIKYRQDGQNILKKILNRGQPANPTTDDKGCIVEGVIEEIATSESTLAKRGHGCDIKITEWKITRS